MKLGLLLGDGVQNKGYNGRMQDYDINMSVFNYAEFGSFGVVFHLQCYSKPFIFKYFIPWCALTTITSISFFIPPKVVPGRGGIMVTMFLVLTNIFSNSKVIKIKKIK